MSDAVDNTPGDDNDEKPTVEALTGFDFSGESVPFEVPETLEDIPKIPSQSKVNFGGETPPKRENPATPRSGAKTRERQQEYRNRIEMAKEASPYVAAALNEYLKSRLDGATIDSATIEVPYWSLETSKGSQMVKGSIAEAMAFHGLAGSSGLTAKFIDMIENHPVLFGMFYIVGCMGYLELIIQKILREQMEAARKAEENPSVAVPKSE